MSRSKRKSPCAGITTARSDKPYKVAASKAARRTARQLLPVSLDGDEPRLHIVRGDPWGSPKDGKQWWPDCDAKFLRK